ncbi:MAG: DUF3576 domain-containing protein [Alphaproteobacteria bacterium]
MGATSGTGFGQWRRAAAVAAVLVAIGLAGCEGTDIQPADRPEVSQGDAYKANRQGTEGSIFGPGGINLFGGNDSAPVASGGIGVNSFLWRASLDTLSFMPLSSADPFGGVIITDWYSPPETPAERFKMTVYILDRSLRADGLKVAVFRQQRPGGGDWTDAGVAPETVAELENAILTRARQLRISTLAE